MSIGRNILGIAGGVLAAGMVIALVEIVGHRIATGNGRFLAAIVGYGLGACAGTFAAMLLTSRGAAIAVPIILSGLAIANLFAFPHPGWFAPAACVMLALGWFVGASLGQWRGGRITGKGAANERVR